MVLSVRGVVEDHRTLRHHSSAVNEFIRKGEDDLYQVATLKRGLEHQTYSVKTDRAENRN